MGLPRRKHKNAEGFPAAGEPDPVNLIGTGISPSRMIMTRRKHKNTEHCPGADGRLAADSSGTGLDAIGISLCFKPYGVVSTKAYDPMRERMIRDTRIRSFRLFKLLWVGLIVFGLQCSGLAWPPTGQAVRVPVVRDTWVSSVKGEQDANLGGAKKLKTKGIQEFTLLDIDPDPLRGRVIHGAMLHLRCRSPKAPQRRLTVSTLASQWAQGTSWRYKTQPSSASFRWAKQAQRLWAHPGSDITAVINGEGHSMWRFADPTPPDAQGWQVVPVEPSVIAARVAGVSHGLVVFDDVGSEYTRRGDRFQYRLFPNRFVYSREAGQAYAPYLTVYFGDQDHQPPAAIEAVQSSATDLPAGQASVSWITPPDAGPAETIGFHARFSTDPTFEWGSAREIPRYLIPMAAPPGQTVTMLLRDLGLSAKQTIHVGIQAVDAAGNVGPIATMRVVTADQPKRSGINQGPAPVEPFVDRAPLPQLKAPGQTRGVSVCVIDALDKVNPVSGAMIPPQPKGYKQANHLWSAKRRLVRLHAAKNEFVVFQIVLTGPTDGAIGEFTFDHDPAAHASQAKLLRLRHVKSNKGWLPDPLVPLGSQPIRIPAKDENIPDQTHAAFLAEVYVPHEAKAGTHTGTLRLACGGPPLTIQVQLHVWDFTLPDHLSFIPQMNCYALPAPPIERAYYRLAHEHRTCLNRLAYNWRGQVRSGHAPDRPNRKSGRFDWTRYDRRFGPLFDGSAFNDLPRRGVPIEAFYLPINENWPMDVNQAFKGSYWADEAFKPHYRKQLIDACRQFAKHCRDKGWDETFFEFYLNNKLFHKKDRWRAASAPWIFDEPVNTQDFWALRWYGTAFHEAVTPIRGNVKMAFRCDISRPQWQRDLLDGVLDINVVSGAFYQYRRRVLARKQRWGEMVYIYGGANGVTGSNVQSAAWCVDAWSQGADGVLPWQTVGNHASWRRADALSLFYPGQPVGLRGPIPSVRLKAYRRGQQDVEYLTILAETLAIPRWALGQEVRQRLGQQAQFHQASEHDAGQLRYDTLNPADLWALRMRVGTMLDRLNPPAKRRWVRLHTPVRDVSALPPMGYVTLRPTHP